jgi:hypothetical protein
VVGVARLCHIRKRDGPERRLRCCGREDYSMPIGIHLPHIGRKAGPEAIRPATIQAEQLGFARRLVEPPLAEELAALRNLSEGRLILGAGVGWIGCRTGNQVISPQRHGEQGEAKSAMHLRVFYASIVNIVWGTCDEARHYL